MFNKIRCLPKCLIIIAVMAVTGLLGAVGSGSPSQSAAVKTVQDETVPTPADAHASSSLSLEGRIARLEERLNLALALKDERIQSINERSESTYKLFQLFGVFAAE